MVRPVHAIARYSYHSWQLFSIRPGSNGAAKNRRKRDVCPPRHADARRNSSKTLAHPETTVLARPSTSTKREIAYAFQDTADAGCIQRPLEIGSAVPTRFAARFGRRETPVGGPVSTTTPRKNTSQDRSA